MPSRKSESSETQAESRRTSLHRLSSIASFQALNPFSRRRSNHDAETSTAGSSASNLSLTSTSANAPVPHKTEPFSNHDELTALPIPPVPTSAAPRRSSYICLPDDPIGGMPRSRTFSNLPLPVRTRRTTPMANSKSHPRLPSALLPTTRIPTPPMSSRRHSNTRLTPAEPKLGVRHRVKRSDTEPLLPVNIGQVSNIGRSTAFKENINNSPVRPLPMYMMENRDFYGAALPSRAYACRHGWMDPSEGSEPLLHPYEVPSLVPRAHYRHQSVAAFSQSSPTYRGARERQPTPGASKPEPVQRWNSQPVLTNVTNRRNSRHAEIKERRLMSEVQPVPPPPPPKTPLSAEALSGGKRKSLSNHLRQVSEQSPSLAALSTKPRAPSPHRSSQIVGLLPDSSPPPPTQPSFYTYITNPEPVPYWAGRFSALNDRYRNEELLAHINSPKSSSDKMHTPEANMRRMRRALDYLHSLCATQEARESFVVFQLQFAALQNMPELGRPMVLNVPERIVLGSRCEDDGVGEVGLMSEKREKSFMSRLLGRGRKSLA